MTQTRPKLQTFADYLAYTGDSEARYELTNGELIEMPPESDDNLYRAIKLYEALKTMVGMRQIRLQGLALAMPGQPKNRYPDLTVLRPEHPGLMRELGQAAVTLEMHPPMLVVEVVSPGPENHRRDYVEKRNQYEWRGIPEYWIIDPQQQQVIVLSLSQHGYEDAVFVGDERVVSPNFSAWPLTATEMLSI